MSNPQRSHVMKKKNNKPFSTKANANNKPSPPTHKNHKITHIQKNKNHNNKNNNSNTKNQRKKNPQTNRSTDKNLPVPDEIEEEEESGETARNNTNNTNNNNAIQPEKKNKKRGVTEAEDKSFFLQLVDSINDQHAKKLEEKREESVSHSLLLSITNHPSSSIDHLLQL